jgi:hypothetical protein
VPGGLFRKFLPGDLVALSSAPYAASSLGQAASLPGKATYEEGQGGEPGGQEYGEPIEAMVSEIYESFIQRHGRRDGC